MDSGVGVEGNLLPLISPSPLRLIEFALLAVLCANGIVCASFYTSRNLDLYKMYIACYVFTFKLVFSTPPLRASPIYGAIRLNEF